MQTDTERRVTRLIIAIGVILFGVFVVIPQAFQILSGRSEMARNPYMGPSTWAAIPTAPTNGAFNAVRLSGTYSATSSQYESGHSGNFEIIMHGADLYYRHHWHKGLERGSYFTELMLTNLSCDLAIRVGPFGSGGGGSGGSVQDRIYPGRRLWAGDTFVGVGDQNEPVKVGDRSFNETEEFRRLEKVGSFIVPREIVCSNWNGRVFTYTVDDIEFSREETPKFFFDMRDKRFKGRFDLSEPINRTNKSTTTPRVK